MSARSRCQATTGASGEPADRFRQHRHSLPHPRCDGRPCRRGELSIILLLNRITEFALLYMQRHWLLASPLVLLALSGFLTETPAQRQRNDLAYASVATLKHQ